MLLVWIIKPVISQQANTQKNSKIITQSLTNFTEWFVSIPGHENTFAVTLEFLATAIESLYR